MKEQKQPEWGVEDAGMTKEAHSREALPYLEMAKKAENEAVELRVALEMCRAQNERLKAEAASPPVVNIFIGGKNPD